MIARAGRVKTNIDGIQRLRTPFVRTADGKGRFLNGTNSHVFFISKPETDINAEFGS
jgi:hypothetical protein